jgi:hypothetical protein
MSNDELGKIRDFMSGDSTVKQGLLEVLLEST